MTKETVRQCPSCPWRVDCVPEEDIPGYSRSLHEGLTSCIARDPVASLFSSTRIMACHYSSIDNEIPCAGWLANQLGPGNNLGLRMALIQGRLPVPEIDGLQHECFEDTLEERVIE